VRVKRVGINPLVIVCEVACGPEVGREVGVRVRGSWRWRGWEGREVVVQRRGAEPWEYRGLEPGVSMRGKWRLALEGRRGR